MNNSPNTASDTPTDEWIAEARRTQTMPPEVIDDLERYYKQLRDYYDIPDDQPVFPPKPRSKSPQRKAAPDPNAQNRPDHPWRAA